MSQRRTVPAHGLRPAPARPGASPDHPARPPRGAHADGPVALPRGAFVPRPVPGQVGSRHAPSPAESTEFDLPSAARVYDYLLGGVTHGAVDRRWAHALLRAEPRAGNMARAARAFLRRAVRFLLDEGIDQFVDLGSGVPTMGNVHEVVARHGGRAAVAYVECDATAVASGRRLLAGVGRTTYVDADVRDTDAVLDHPDLRAVIDLSRPVGLLAFSVLQQVPDADDPAGLVDRYLARLAPGSALALSHATIEALSLSTETFAVLAGDHPFPEVRLRDHREVARMLRGVDLVAPGLTFAARWRPDLRRAPAPPAHCGHLAAVGFRP